MMNSASSVNHLRRSLVLAGCALALGWSAVQGVSLLAQRLPAQRTVQGRIMDKDNAPVNGAVVYLKDDHTMSLKSFITNADGAYRFGQLSQNTDYELWAEKSGKKSGTKTISSFDTKQAIQLDLKIEK
ncbi:MAG TPA: carboxypeptidase-like regulatory domain-containing protein [Granulicella sp.]